MALRKTYTSCGDISSVTDAENYAETSLHRVDAQDNVDEWETTLYYNDGRGLAIKKVDALGNVASYAYDGQGTAGFLASPVSHKIESWTHYNEWGDITRNTVIKAASANSTW